MNKRVLSAAIAATLVAPTATQAVNYSLSGQVNRAFLFQDDGVNSGYSSVGAETSGTRFRFRGSEDLGNGLTIGMFWEWQNPSNNGSQATPTASGQMTDDDVGTVRQANVWFSAPFGKVTVGQTDGAGNDTTETDLTNLYLSGVSSARSSFSAALAWRTENGASIGSTSGSTFDNVDAYSRYDGIRYDTPSFGGVKAAVSYGNDVMEGAVRYNGSVGYGNISTAAFYGKRTSDEDDYRYGGSASYSFPFGTNITASYGYLDRKGGEDADNWYLRLAHLWGNNAIGIGYGVAEDFTPGYENTGIQVGFVHKLPRANSEVYASYTFEELDVGTGTDPEDHHIAAVGARVRFN